LLCHSYFETEERKANFKLGTGTFHCHLHAHQETVNEALSVVFSTAEKLTQLNGEVK